MAIFFDLYKKIRGKTFEQTWEKIDWNTNQEQIIEQIKSFLEKKVNPNETNSKEETIMEIAIERHNFDVAEFLAENGAKDISDAFSNGKLFYKLAAEHNKYCILNRKKQEGTEDPYMTFDSSFATNDLEKMEHLMDTMIKHGFNPDVTQIRCVCGKPKYGVDILTSAASVGNLRLVKFLHVRGAKIEKQDVVFRKIPCLSVMTAAVRSGNIDTLDYLYKNGGIIDSEKLFCKDFSPLSMAVISKNEEMLDFLLDRKCNINRPSGIKKWTPLMHAASMENEQEANNWIDKLISRGADATIQDVEGQTASQIAQKYFDKKSLARKLEKIAKKQQDNKNTNYKDIPQETAFKVFHHAGR